MMNLGRKDEFKEFITSTDELENGLIAITSMLNKHCKAQLYFGVNDNGDVIGQDIGMDTLEKIAQAANDSIDPHIIPDIDILTSDDGRRYISIYAEAHDKPYLYNSIAYIRTGAEDRKAAHDDLRKMILGSNDLLKDTKSTDQNLKFTQLLDILNENGRSDKEDVSFYSDFGLKNSEGSFNKQASLLSDENNIRLTVAVFEGTDRSRLSLRKDFGEGCILNAIRSAMDYIESINEKFTDVSGPTHSEKDLFDISAFKEAWINACVHNNWICQIPPAIHIFDDRIEIISYGGKPYDLSEEEFFNGRSLPVNESLMEVFIAAGMSEHTGHGIPLITNVYGRKTFELSGSCMIVKLRFCRKRTASNYHSNVPRTKLSDGEFLILAALKEHPDFNLDQISELTGLSRSTVGKAVPSLRRIGYIERKGSLRDGSWIVHAEIGEAYLG